MPPVPPVRFIAKSEKVNILFAAEIFPQTLQKHLRRRHAVTNDVQTVKVTVIFFKKRAKPRHLARRAGKKHSRSFVEQSFHLPVTISHIALHIF